MLGPSAIHNAAPIGVQSGGSRGPVALAFKARGRTGGRYQLLLAAPQTFHLIIKDPAKGPVI